MQIFLKAPTPTKCLQWKLSYCTLYACMHACIRTYIHTYTYACILHSATHHYHPHGRRLQSEAIHLHQVPLLSSSPPSSNPWKHVDHENISLHHHYWRNAKVHTTTASLQLQNYDDTLQFSSHYGASDYWFTSLLDVGVCYTNVKVQWNCGCTHSTLVIIQYSGTV